LLYAAWAQGILLNIQTEQLEHRTARMTVHFETDQFEKAKQKAAQQLANRVSIPGFRKGKAPYRVLANYVGEEAIIDDAIEILSNKFYKDALEEAKLEPYGPGSIEDYSLEPLAVQYLVPLQPNVTLGAYRDVRVEYKPTEVTDETLDQAMKNLQVQHGLVEESRDAVEMGNRVTIDIHSHLKDEPEEEFLHEHDFVYMVDSTNEPLAGFAQALVGAKVEELHSFELTLGEDAEENAGKFVHFEVTVKKIEVITLPALNDDFAARVTASEETPLTLLELRVKLRESLAESAAAEYKNEYADSVFVKIVDGAQVEFPAMMIDEQVKLMIEELDGRLRQRGLTLQDYIKITKNDEAKIAADYRPSAEVVVKRSLIMSHFAETEQIKVNEEELIAEFGRILTRFGSDPDPERVQELLSNKMISENIIERLGREKISERLIAVGRGEAPDLTALIPEVVEAVTETPAETKEEA
jgi:trigger factor